MSLIMKTRLFYFLFSETVSFYLIFFIIKLKAKNSLAFSLQSAYLLEVKTKFRFQIKIANSRTFNNVGMKKKKWVNVHYCCQKKTFFVCVCVYFKLLYAKSKTKQKRWRVKLPDRVFLLQNFVTFWGSKLFLPKKWLNFAGKNEPYQGKKTTYGSNESRLWFFVLK